MAVTVTETLLGTGVVTSVLEIAAVFLIVLPTVAVAAIVA